MVRIKCKHVTEAGPPSRGVATAIVHLRLIEGAPASMEARRSWIEAEAFLCGICTASLRLSLDALEVGVCLEGGT